MKFLVSLCFLLSFAFNGHAWALPEASAPAEGSACEAYLQISADLGCADSNYLQKFGYHYCRKFETEQDQYSTRGQTTLKAIRECLLEDLGQQTDLTCENVETRSQAAHIKCYKESGFCEMGKANQVRVFRSIWRELKNPNYRRVAARVFWSCQEKYNSSTP